MGSPIDAALADPWGTARLVLGDPLHPGGEKATADLLDRADVHAGTRLLDVGCGAGNALSLARDRGAHATGIDREPDPGPGTIRGDLTALPVADDAVEVVLSECTLCLADDVGRALAEADRVLEPGGRLAMSDVVVETDAPALPAPLAEALCLTGSRTRADLLGWVEDAGFAVVSVQDHREDLLAMRDRATSRVNYEGLLAAMGERGQRILDAVRELEAAVEDGRIGYVSLVATA